MVRVKLSGVRGAHLTRGQTKYFCHLKRNTSSHTSPSQALAACSMIWRFSEELCSASSKLSFVKKLKIILRQIQLEKYLLNSHFSNSGRYKNTHYTDMWRG